MRYAIQNAQGQYFSHTEIVGTKKVMEQDGHGADFVHKRHVLAPIFEAGHPRAASRYETEADALTALNHPDLQDPEAFSGCKVVPVDA